MSLTQTVAALIVKAGSAAPEDLMPHFPDFTRDQVMKAMQNGARAGLVHKGASGRYQPGPRQPIAPAVPIADARPRHILDKWLRAPHQLDTSSYKNRSTTWAPSSRISKQ